MHQSLYTIAKKVCEKATVRSILLKSQGGDAHDRTSMRNVVCNENLLYTASNYFNIITEIYE